MSFNNTSKKADKRSQRRAVMKAGKINASTTSEITLRKKGAFNRGREWFRLEVKG